MSFSWIFALIVGAAILFGAIYMISQISKTSEMSQSATSASELGAIFDSLQSTQESAKTAEIKFPLNSSIRNRCDLAGEFGTQKLSVEQYIKGEWTRSNLDITYKNKYIFSKEITYGETFLIFTKQLNYPYKVANLIYLTSLDDKYCFKNPPRDVRSEIKDLSLYGKNIILDDCTDETTNVCFRTNTEDCDVFVQYNQGYLVKEENRTYFENDAMLYGAIFSDIDVYECQMARLMKRANILSKIYYDKAVSLIDVCEPSTIGELNQLMKLTEEYNNTKDDLMSIDYLVGTMESKNKYSRCRLW